MFEGRKVKKLERAMEQAAIELSVAEQLGPPPGDPSHAQASQAIVDAAERARAVGRSDEVQGILAAADDHPMYRGSQKDQWLQFVAGVRSQL